LIFIQSNHLGITKYNNDFLSFGMVRICILFSLHWICYGKSYQCKWFDILCPIRWISTGILD